MVTTTNVPLHGASDVAVVVDSLEGSIAGTRRDTLLFRVSADGDLYEWGYLAGALKRWEARTIPPAWDRIAAFSLGSSTPWVVGTADSTGEVQVIGNIVTDPDFFQVNVNNVSTVYSAYRVDISGDDLEISLWLADNPFSIPQISRYVLAPSASTGGELRELTDLVVPSP
jgi:hypothetical protein